jgi:hypothetical protein
MFVVTRRPVYLLIYLNRPVLRGRKKILLSEYAHPESGFFYCRHFNYIINLLAHANNKIFNYEFLIAFSLKIELSSGYERGNRWF